MDASARQPKRRQGSEAQGAAATAPTGEVDRRFKRTTGVDGSSRQGRDGRPQKSKYDDTRAAEIEDQARLAAAFATFGRLVAAGEDPGTAHVATVRALAAAGHNVLARAYCEGIGPVVPEELARVALGVCLYRMRRYDVVWEQIAGVDPAVLARHALVEAVDSALNTRTPEGGRGGAGGRRRPVASRRRRPCRGWRVASSWPVSRDRRLDRL